MAENLDLFDRDLAADIDPSETPIRDRKVITQPYDIVIDSLINQVDNKTIFLRPLSDRPDFQRKYVWKDDLASRLIESILLNVPIPPCYLSQNDAFELDVVDGQQRIYSIYRFVKNQFALSGLKALDELNGKRFHEISGKFQKKINTHTLRCVVITNESHSEIKFDVFERLNTNTMPLNPQELRNCIYRGALISMLKLAVEFKPWLDILKRKQPDIRMSDEEVVLRFISFHIHGVSSYRTPYKQWLNEAALAGQSYSVEKIEVLSDLWNKTINTSLILFDSKECFRRAGSKTVNKALFDLTMSFSARISSDNAVLIREEFRNAFFELQNDTEFSDLISRAIDHKTRVIRRFEMWEEKMARFL